MSTNQWKRLKALFDQATQLPADDRSRFVQKIIDEDPDLGRELEQLLVHDAPADGALTDAVHAVANAVGEAEQSQRIGYRFGPYRLLEQIGRGGMGEVYLAERADGEFEQHVAIKLIGAGAFSADMVERFRAERQILARLDHPNIARILDGGTTDEGVTYLVMEYIDGMSVLKYCDANDLPLKKRLQLFLSICDAIEFAHRNLVVHRDIKPSNIMVSNDGLPKLLDFGIAKLLQPNLDNTAPATALVMTPDYSSPEQILGQPVTTSCDVYSLGVLLYEMVAGIRPYDLSGKRPSEMEKEICDTTPEKPSVAVRRTQNKPARVVRAQAQALEGDLDTVVMMALRRNPLDRYQSVHAFAADLRCYLQGQPVSAKARSFAYLTQKFLQRNRWPVGVAAAILVGIASAFVFHVERIGTERDRVVHEAKRSAAVTEYLQSIFEISSPDESLGELVSAKDVLERGAKRLQVELRDQPDIRARLMTSIGAVYENMGLTPESAEYTQKAIDVQRTLNDPNALIQSLTQLAGIKRNSGEFVQSREALDEALQISAQTAGRESEESARVLYELGELNLMEGDFDQALKMHTDVHDMLERIDSTDEMFKIETLFMMGQALQFMADHENAEKYMRRGLEELNQLEDASPTTRAALLHNFATLLHEIGNYAEAEPFYLEAYEIEQRVLGADHPLADVAITNLGRLYRDMGQLDLAEEYLTLAVEHARNLHGTEHFFTAYNMKNLADLLRDKQNYTESDAMYLQIISTYNKTLEPDNPYIASAKTGYSRLLNAMNRSVEAEQLAREALDLCLSVLGEAHWLTATAFSDLSDALILQERYDEAEPLLARALSSMQEALPTHLINHRLEKQLATLYQKTGDTVAQAHYQKLVENRAVD